MSKVAGKTKIKKYGMYTKQELIRMWANDGKRRAFAKNFRAWGVWFKVPRLDLTFYKFDLPEAKIIAMENLRAPYGSEGSEPLVCSNLYLQHGAYFSPRTASDSEIAEHLKKIKVSLQKQGSS